MEIEGVLVQNLIHQKVIQIDFLKIPVCRRGFVSLGAIFIISSFALPLTDIHAYGQLKIGILQQFLQMNAVPSYNVF